MNLNDHRVSKRSLGTRCMTVASILSALAALLLTVGYYLQLLEFFWYFIASLCLLIVLIRYGIRAALLAYAASVLLALPLCSFSFFFILPFAILMGPYAIVDAVMKKHCVRALIGHAIKAVWFCASVLAMILFTGLFFFIDLEASPLVIWLVIGLCVPVYALYDVAVRAVAVRLAAHLTRFSNTPKI